MILADRLAAAQAVSSDEVVASNEVVGKVTINNNSVVISFPNAITTEHLVETPHAVQFKVRVPDFVVNISNAEGESKPYRIRGGQKLFNLKLKG